MAEQVKVTAIHKDSTGLKVMLVVCGHSIEDVLQAFEAVLRGATYCFNGHLEIVEDEL